jgi:hypothetical protein
MITAALVLVGALTLINLFHVVYRWGRADGLREAIEIVKGKS